MDEGIEWAWALCDDWFFRFAFDQHWDLTARCPHGQFHTAGPSLDEAWERLMVKIEEAHG